MREEMTAIDTIRRARFEADVSAIMAQRHAQHFALSQHFTRQSEAFPALRSDILDHYFFERRHLSPLFAVDAMVQLVDRMIDIMRHQSSQQAA